jgi:hypothetical protein
MAIATARPALGVKITSKTSKLSPPAHQHNGGAQDSPGATRSSKKPRLIDGDEHVGTVNGISWLRRQRHHRQHQPLAA